MVIVRTGRKENLHEKTPQPQAEGIELDLVSTWSAPPTKAAFLSIAAVLSLSLAVSGPLSARLSCEVEGVE